MREVRIGLLRNGWTVDTTGGHATWHDMESPSLVGGFSYCYWRKRYLRQAMQLRQYTTTGKTDKTLWRTNRLCLILIRQVQTAIAGLRVGRVPPL